MISEGSSRVTSCGEKSPSTGCCAVVSGKVYVDEQSLGLGQARAFLFRLERLSLWRWHSFSSSGQ